MPLSLADAWGMSWMTSQCLTTCRFRGGSSPPAPVRAVRVAGFEVQVGMRDHRVASAITALDVQRQVRVLPAQPVDEAGEHASGPSWAPGLCWI